MTTYIYYSEICDQICEEFFNTKKQAMEAAEHDTYNPNLQIVGEVELKELQDGIKYDWKDVFFEKGESYLY